MIVEPVEWCKMLAEDCATVNLHQLVLGVGSAVLYKATCTLDGTETDPKRGKLETKKEVGEWYRDKWRSGMRGTFSEYRLHGCY